MEQPAAIFHSDYAKALAEALREAEELSKNDRDDRELLQETYRQLCFDFPRGISSRSCLQLSQLLLKEKTSLQDDHDYSSSVSTYILTDRFVSGLLQALNRVERPKEIPRPDGSSETREEQQSLLVPSPDTESNTDSALAILGWTVFIRIPLKVLTAKTIADASKFLGSYLGEPINMNESDSDDNYSNGNEQRGAPTTEAKTIQTVQRVENNNGHHSAETLGDMNEIWAEESDDSDFEFESYRFQSQQTADSQNENDSVVFHDKGRVGSWEQVAQAISNLIQHCSWAKLSCLPMNQWQRHNISMQLTQIVLMLMQQQPSDSPIYQVFPAYYWRRLALYPIHFFRDATLLHSEQLLGDYLQLVAALIQTTPSKLDNSQQLKSSSALNPCTILGFSLLSALCGSLLGESKTEMRTSVHKNIQHLRLLQQNILDLSDELTLMLEESMREVDPRSLDSISPTLADPSAVATTAPTQATAIPWAFLSLWRVLIEASDRKNGLNATQAQTLLNSGLFRQWIRWWECVQQDAKTPAGEPAGATEAVRVVEETILDACLVSPKLLGKYAWRFPGFACRVCFLDDELGMRSEEVHLAFNVTLWNLLANELAATNVTEPSIIWRKKINTVDAIDSKGSSPPTLTSCQETAWRSFRLARDHAFETIIDWKNRRQENLPFANNLTRQTDAVMSFVSLIHRLAAMPHLLSASFTANLMTDDSSTGVSTAEGRIGTMKPSSLVRFHEVLYEWPSAPEQDKSFIKIKETDTEVSTQQMSEINRKDAENKKANEAARKARLQHQVIDESIRELRRCLKVFQSVLESLATAEISASGSIVMDNIGSKAD